MCETDDSIRLDQEIANRLQNEHPEQFITLVRMHLSFELDLNIDTENDPINLEKLKSKKWKGFHKKARSCASIKSTSPEAAKTVLTKQNISDIKLLIQFLIQEQNIAQEGIFRKTGSLSRQNELKNTLVQGLPVFLEKGDYTAHDCASVLKSFLADLGEPLLTEHYYPAYCQVAELYHSKDCSVAADRIITAIQLLFLLLPKENNILLKCIMELLYKTMQYETTNKMTADNLATLFTPHLICPRKLSPEALHITSQQMCSIISFMIQLGPRLFHIPAKLATDIRAFYMERKRRKTMSPEHILNESITSETVANTVYTFVDREKTAEAHVMNSTDTALAQLYAHIQSLPESSKKKKLIKQFNRENGHGTPLQVLMLREKNSGGSTIKGHKSIGDSIKRHIFHKSLVSRTPKSSTHANGNFFQNTPNGPVSHTPKQRVLFQSPLSSAANSPVLFGKRCSATSTSSFSSSEGLHITSILGNSSPACTIIRSNSNSSENSVGSYKFENRRTVELTSDSDDVSGKRLKLSEDHEDEEPPPPEDDEDFVEQEGDHIGDDDDTDELQDDGRTLSDTEDGRYCAQDVVNSLSDSRSKFKSEPNLSTIVHEGNGSRLHSGSKEKTITFLKNKLIKGVSMGNLRLPFSNESRASKKTQSNSLLKSCFDDNLKGIKKSDCYPTGSIATMASPDCRLMRISPLCSRDKSDSLEECERINMINENNANLDTNSWNTCYLTSTPAITGRDSMSPITKSTQRMPKSMQESIMTPRSRKPVMLLAGLNTGDQQHSAYASQSSFSSLREEDEEDGLDSTTVNNKNTAQETQSSEVQRKIFNVRNGTVHTADAINTTYNGNGEIYNSNADCVISSTGNIAEESGSLTSTFREYLMSRSVLTDSPADLSFSSQSDDFDSSAEIEDLSESKMSDSLLFCMNGNSPNEWNEPESTLVNARKLEPTTEINVMDTGVILETPILPCRSILDETSL